MTHPREMLRMTGSLERRGWPTPQASETDDFLVRLQQLQQAMMIALYAIPYERAPFSTALS